MALPSQTKINNAFGEWDTEGIPIEWCQRGLLMPKKLYGILRWAEDSEVIPACDKVGIDAFMCE